MDVVDAVRKSSTLSVDCNAETDPLTSIFPMSAPPMLEALEDPETRINKLEPSDLVRVKSRETGPPAVRLWVAALPVASIFPLTVVLIQFAWTAPGKNPSSRAPTMANRFGGLVSRVMAGASPYNMGTT